MSGAVVLMETRISAYRLTAYARLSGPLRFVCQPRLYSVVQFAKIDHANGDDMDTVQRSSNRDLYEIPSAVRYEAT